MVCRMQQSWSTPVSFTVVLQLISYQNEEVCGHQTPFGTIATPVQVTRAHLASSVLPHTPAAAETVQVLAICLVCVLKNYLARLSQPAIRYQVHQHLAFVKWCYVQDTQFVSSFFCFPSKRQYHCLQVLRKYDCS